MEREIKLCKKYKEEFLEKSENLESELRGMNKSELLLIYSIIKKYGSKHIIESGRARGFSTQVLAKTLDSKSTIISIDFDKYSKDTKYSEKILEKYDNVKLIYGDSKKIIPEHIDTNTIILIDGPKGEDAIILAANLLQKFSQISAIFIHDLSKEIYEREIAKSIFPDIVFADDNEFIKEFKSIDPPRLRNKSQIALIHNSKSCVDNRVFVNYLQYYKNTNNVFRNKLKKIIVNNALLYSLYIKSLHLLPKQKESK